MMLRLRVGTAVAALALSLPASAEVKPNSLFSDNAVLQAGMRVPVWGTARDGERVTVKINGQSGSATAAGGRWRVDLPAMKPGGPFDMTIQGDNTITVHNVLVGEVWIASGQSNMEMSLASCAGGGPDGAANTSNTQRAIANSADPMLRLLTVKRQATDEPLSDANVQWVECNPSTVPNFSAVAYFFGRDLRASRKVPVGLISTNYGGTPAEAWTSREGLMADPNLSWLLDEFQQRPANDPARRSPQRPCGLYNAMIVPLLPYAIRGAIWYQGESNAGRAVQYRVLFPAMIKDWRRVWGEGDFPFFFVQLAPFMKISPEPMESAWAELRDAQLYTTKALKNAGEAVITDVGDEVDIHPKRKEPVGGRLALCARAIAYGEKIEYSGPAFDSAKIDGNRMVLRFKHSAGLTAPGGSPEGFTIAGEDRKFYNAKALIDGDRIIVWSDSVRKPVAVRYGWANFPVVNVANGAGLPASPFRTDDWPMITAAASRMK